MIRVSRRVVPLLALLAAALLACDDDTTVVVAVGDPVPPPGQPPTGGAVIVVTNSSLERDATAARATSAAAGGRVHEGLHLPSPRGPARIAADNHAVAADPGTGGKNFDSDTDVDFGRDVAARHAFLRVGLRATSRGGARILDARLQIPRALRRPRAGTRGLRAGLVPRDGLWDDLRRPPTGAAPRASTPSPSRSTPTACRLRDGAGAGGPRTSASGIRVAGALASSSQVGQTLTIWRAGTLARLGVQLRRVGVLDGNTRIRVERCRTDDGSDDRPDGVPLALSEPVAASTIDSGLWGSLVATPSSRPPLAADARYAFVLETDFPGSAENHLQWKIHHGNAYPAGGLVNYGRKLAWNIVATRS
jgi:hypothetical protein